MIQRDKLDQCSTCIQSAQIVMMTKQLDDVRIYISTYIFFKCVQDECLELPETFVNSCSAAFFHDRFGRLQRINNCA